MPSFTLQVRNSLRSTLTDGESESVQLRRLLLSVLKAERQSVVSPDGTEPAHACNVFLSDAEIASLRRWSGSDEPVPVVAMHAIEQAIAAELTATSPAPDASPTPSQCQSQGHIDTIFNLIRSSGLSVTPDQITYVTRTVNALNEPQRNIVLAEASTGVGKGIVLAALAESMAQKSEEAIIICAPTYAILMQLGREFKRITDRPAAYLCGRNEFVDVSALRQFISDRTDARSIAIATWLHQGGRASDVDVFDSPYLIESLRGVIDRSVQKDESLPPFDLSEYTIDESTPLDDEGLCSYLAQFKLARDKKVVFVTHAMLAFEMLIRFGLAVRTPEWRQDKPTSQELLQEQVKIRAEILSTIDGASRLPPFKNLIIDEAHTLEQAFSNALSTQLSVHKLISSLMQLRAQGARISLSQIDVLKIAESSLCAAKRQHNRDLLINPSCAPEIRHFRDEIVKLAVVLNEIKLPKKSAETSAGRYVSVAKRALKQWSNSFNTVLITHSEVRHYPRIVIGSSSCDWIFRYLWHGLHSAVLASATLYAPQKNGQFSSAYMRETLAIPRERYHDIEPVTASWLVQGVTLYLPGVRDVGGRHFLCVPDRKKDNAETIQSTEDISDWINELTDVAQYVVATAAGGTFMLCTSYEQVERLTSALDHRRFMNPVIAAHPTLNTNAQKMLFLKSASAGEKPLWLAVGAAWTGMSISGAELGIPAELDNICTDLIVAKLPYGTNKSVSHTYRTEVMGRKNLEALETALRLRQGLGRLKRRAGLPNNRRIWFCDGRVFSNQSNGFYSVMAQILYSYPKRKYFTTIEISAMHSMSASAQNRIAELVVPEEIR